MQEHRHLTLWCFLSFFYNKKIYFIYSEGEDLAAILFPSRPVTSTCFFAKHEYFWIFVCVHNTSVLTEEHAYDYWRLKISPCVRHWVNLNKSDIIISCYFTLWYHHIKLLFYTVKISKVLWSHYENMKIIISKDSTSCTACSV